MQSEPGRANRENLVLPDGGNDGMVLPTATGIDAGAVVVAIAAAFAASTHYRWSMSRDSMRHEQRSAGDGDYVDR
jgi:hypothetical protein